MFANDGNIVKYVEDKALKRFKDMAEKDIATYKMDFDKRAVSA